MNALANLPRILLVDSNVYFAKRVGEALQQVGSKSSPARRPPTHSRCSNGTRPPPFCAPRICAKWARSKWLRFCAPIPRPHTFR